MGCTVPRYAIFVDAGYLFAQGSMAITGSKQARANLSLNIKAAIDELLSTARSINIEQKLLRVYWYDGARGAVALPSDHAEVARTPYVKLRLGMINGVGQQKGVDSLIVTDLIELARNRAIDDAVLLSGDDDIRVGVSIAQTFGVCVHVVGIAPSIGSQSPLLLQEADTTTEWGSLTVGKFLSTKIALSANASTEVMSTHNLRPAINEEIQINTEARPHLTAATQEFVAALSDDTLRKLITGWSAGQHGIPTDIDRPLLTLCGSKIGRRLEASESRYMRDKFAELVRGRAPGP